MRKKSSYLTIIIILIFLIITVTSDNIQAKNSTIVVDSAGNGDYTTIQQAIDQAETGDTIYIKEGTYKENLVINKKINLQGENKENTIIDGQKKDHTLQVGTEKQDISINISELTIKNAGRQGNDCIILTNAKNGEIKNNIIAKSERGDGIQLDQCTDINIESNHIEDNEQGSGIFLIESTENTIQSNIIEGNNKGIYIYYLSKDNLIQKNTLQENIMHGIHIFNSKNNILYHNDFKSNNQNAEDTSTNQWYNSTLKEGNYWSDYTGTDADNDGIGDTPYQIPGNGNSQDKYPLGYFEQTPQTNNPPQAEAGGAYQAKTNQTIKFDGTNSNDEDGTITRYDWKYSSGDNWNNDIGAEPEYYYQKPGTYIVTLRVHDNDGATNTDTTTATIQTTLNANANGPYKGTPNYQTVFNASKSTGKNLQYRWNFNNDQQWDTNWVNTPYATHTYTQKGTYQITLEIKNTETSETDQDTTTAEISTNKPPTTQTNGPYTAKTDEKINLKAINSYDPDGNVTEYTWNLGEGTTKKGKNITHQYTKKQNYTITLTVKDNDGNTNHTTTYAKITNKQESSNTPGFEIILILISITLYMLFFKKQK